MKKILILLILCFACKKEIKTSNIFVSDSLQIEKISDNIFKHTSFLKEYQNFPCNGMIYKRNKQVIVFDTPTDSESSLKLINWIKNELDSEIKAVVVTHFHIDCLGGLAEFHKKNIPSYSTNLTFELAKKNTTDLPKNKFDSELILTLDKKKVINKFFGRGHSYDNIVSYIPDEKVLFGGCLIKENGAKKGNLKDSDTTEWASTVKSIKNTYKEVKIIIPGHGKIGGPELLDFTIELFKNK